MGTVSPLFPHLETHSLPVLNRRSLLSVAVVLGWLKGTPLPGHHVSVTKPPWAGSQELTLSQPSHPPPCSAALHLSHSGPFLRPVFCLPPRLWVPCGQVQCPVWTGLFCRKGSGMSCPGCLLKYLGCTDTSHLWSVQSESLGMVSVFLKSSSGHCPRLDIHSVDGQ